MKKACYSAAPQPIPHNDDVNMGALTCNSGRYFKPIPGRLWHKQTRRTQRAHMCEVQKVLHQKVPAVGQVALEPAALQGRHTLISQLSSQGQGGRCGNNMPTNTQHWLEPGQAFQLRNSSQYCSCKHVAIHAMSTCICCGCTLP